MPGRLISRRPSPTTVSFTVSNASRHTSTPAKILFYFQILLRALIFVCVVFFNIARQRDSYFYQDGSALRCPVVVTLVSAVVIYGVFRKGYTGIQTSTSSLTYLSKASTRFIPTTQIQDIVIHEAFKGFEVRFYLAVIVEGEPEVVVVFPKLLPKRAILEEVWRGSRRCLYDSKS
ncbi:hypothetical protein EYZ11_000314 [Aspergillus tanneri]|uniref:Phosphatidylinositol N-acetylglucosaminyltransferase subunit H conserved domain-containing protein n=1 Tax=Aspergillus tanneri TaxID=1220188 RepID=A0A4S3JY13_9EURO|nr:hypothetical protein EYZ11_000314 [Aspergillus tanneri]